MRAPTGVLAGPEHLDEHPSSGGWFGLGCARRRARLAGAGAVLLPAALAFGLCLFDLASRSIWIDESATIAITNQHGAALWAAMRHDGGNMLVYYALVHVLISWFGDGAFVLRFPSAVADAVLAGAAAALGSRLVSRSVGLAAGLLTAISLPLVYWGQDARAYSMLFAFVTLSYVAFVALVDCDSEGRPGKPPAWAWPLYVVSLVLGSYMSILALLVVPAQLLALAWRRRRARAVIVALVLVAILDVPLAVIARTRGTGQIFWIPRPSLSGLVAVIETVAGSAAPPEFRPAATSLPLLYLMGFLLVLFAGAALVVARRRRPTSRAAWAALVIGGWLVLPSALDAAESSVGQSIFEPRYLLLSAPAVSLALAAAVTWLFRRPVLVWPALCGLLALRALQIAPTYGVSPEGWRAAAGYVLAHTRPGDCIAFYPSDGRQAVDYYLRPNAGSRLLPRPVLPSAPWSAVRPYVEDYVSLSKAQVSSDARACPRMWFVVSHEGSRHGTPTSQANFRRYRTLLRGWKSQYDYGLTRGFGYAATVFVHLFSHTPLGPNRPGGA